MQKKFTILIGKSASGKSTLADHLTDFGYKKYKTATTRPMRENETKNDYEFISEKQFLNRLNKGKFIEYNTYDVVYDGKQQTWYYGTPIKNMLFDFSKYVIVLTLDGAIEFAKHYGRENCEIIYLECPDDVRKKWAMRRGSFQEDEWNRRLLADEKDFELVRVLTNCDSVIRTDCHTITQIITKIKYGHY